MTQPTETLHQEAEHEVVPPPVTSYESVIDPVYVRYLESSPIVVSGTATGKRYEFSSTYPEQPVDARDAEALLRTRFFRRSY